MGDSLRKSPGVLHLLCFVSYIVSVSDTVFFFVLCCSPEPLSKASCSVFQPNDSEWGHRPVLMGVGSGKSCRKSQVTFSDHLPSNILEIWMQSSLVFKAHTCTECMVKIRDMSPVKAFWTCEFMWKQEKTAEKYFVLSSW